MLSVQKSVLVTVKKVRENGIKHLYFFEKQDPNRFSKQSLGLASELL
jgi:hypothetical protein